MDKSSLFIINTPFQTLCAIEAIKEYKIIDYKIVILRNVNDTFNSKTEEILADFNLKFTYIFIQSFFELLKKGILKEYDKELYIKNYDKVFIGDYYSTSFRAFASFFLKKETKLILLDDGVATIFLYEYGLNYILKKTTSTIIKSNVSNALMLFYNKKKIQFFSIFKPSDNNILYKENTLSILKPDEEVSISKKSFIIGAKISEASMITEDEYFLLLKNITEIFPDENFYYCPHRAESTEKLEKIEKEFNFKFFNTEYTIEYDFYKKNISPNIVIGFGSTALYTLKTIYPKLNAYTMSFKSNKTINTFYKILDEVLKKQGIKFIE